MYAIARSEPSLVPGNKRYGLCSRAKVLLALLGTYFTSRRSLLPVVEYAPDDFNIYT